MRKRSDERDRARRFVWERGDTRIMRPPNSAADIVRDACEVLGINRTRDGDLDMMVRALSMLPRLNTAEETRRLHLARWVLRNWSIYQAECQRRRVKR
jgi:hypothetical protein